MIKNAFFLLQLVLILISTSTTLFAEEIDYETKSEACAQCHSGETVDVIKSTQEGIDESVHEGTYCLECHKDLQNETYSDDVKNAHPNKVAKVACATCHEDAAEAYTKHGIAEVGTEELIPQCTNCHGTHNILEVADTNSLAHERNLYKTCAQCHEHSDAAKEFGVLNNSVLGKYQSSVHGLANMSDTSNAAKCKSCHFTDDSAHKIYAPGEPTAKINHFNSAN